MSNTHWSGGGAAGSGAGGGSAPPELLGGSGPRPVSALAVSSLVFSLLFCVPFITSLAGVLLGVVGVAVTGPMGRRSGRGIALAGLILGVLGLLGWGYLTVQAYRNFVTPLLQAQEFVSALKQDEFDRAARFTVPPFDPARLPELARQVRELGEFRGLDDGRPKEFKEGDVRGWAVSGVAVFEKGRRRIAAEVVQTPEGWRLRKLELEPLPAARNGADDRDRTDDRGGAGEGGREGDGR